MPDGAEWAIVLLSLKIGGVAMLAALPVAYALAWVLAQGDHVIPIPGTRRAEHLRDWQVPALDAGDLAEIERILPAGFAHGDRYGDHQTAFVERYC